MAQSRYLFASVDSPPDTGGVALLAQQVSKKLMSIDGKEGVYVAPQGSYFERGSINFKFYEDFHSDTKLRAGVGASLEDERICDLFVKLIESHKLDRIVVWHPFYYGLGAIEAARLCDIPVAVFVHGTELTSQLPQTRIGPIETPIDPMSEELGDRLRTTLESADVVLTNSSYSASLIRNAHKAAPITIVGCGIDESEYADLVKRSPFYNPGEKRRLRLRYGLPEAPTMIAVGRLVPHKNHFAMLSLLACMPEWQLLIVGDGPCYDQIVEQARELGVLGRVLIKRNVEDREKFRLMRASEIGLLVSTYNEETGGYEGFGIVMLEYAASGCMPVTNGQFGMQDFAIRMKGGIVLDLFNQTFDMSAAQLLDSIADQSFMKAQLDHTRKVISDNFTWKKVAERVTRSWSGLSS